MSKYLLLRDNRQTGPHSFEEMLELGFRKYDLVWVEGKSAAWRYPGEINEFKEYAPLVEEQPFDRFFKKAVSSEQGAESRPKVEIKETLEKSIGVKHEEIEKRREALTESKQKQDDSRYLPKEKPETVSEVRMVKTAERHRKVAITMPATRRTNSIITAQPKKQEPETRYVPVTTTVPVVTPVVPAALKPEDDVATLQPISNFSSKSSKGDYTQYLQYAGVAAALVSLLVVGILIGMGISNGPVPTAPLSVEQPSRITELKEKLSDTPPAEPVSAVSQYSTTDVPSDYPKITKSPAKKSAQTQNAIPVNTSFNTSGDPAPITNDGKREAVKRETEEQENPPATVPDISKISLSLNEYKVNMFGGIDDIEVTVMNSTGLPLEEVVVELRYILSNKRKNYLTETLIFQDLKPGETQTLPGPKSNRGIKLESSVVSAK